MPRETASFRYTDLAKNDWQRLSREGSRGSSEGSARGRDSTSDAQATSERGSVAPEQSAVHNNWLSRINAAKSEKLEQKGHKQPQHALPEVRRNMGLGESGETQISSQGSGSPSGTGKAVILAAEQASDEVAMAQKKAEEEASAPLKVPIPGPKPLDQKRGIRPNAGLWTALGGGVAVVLSSCAPVEAPPPVGSTLAHRACVAAAAWSRDGAQLLTADVKGVAILWDILSGTALRRMKSPESGLPGIYRVDWSPTQQQVVCAASEGRVLVWDTSTGAIQHTLVGHNTYGTVRTCRFSPDGSMIASGGDFGIFIVWDAASGKALRKMTGHSDHVNSCSWSPDSKRVASGSADNLLIVMHVHTDATPLILGKHSQAGAGDLDGITCVQWNPKGHSIASARRDSRILLHDAKRGELKHDLVGHTAPVLSCVWSSDGARLASCAEDNNVIVWDAEGGAALHTLIGHQLSAKTCGWDLTGQRLVTASADGKLLVWDAEAGTVVQELESLQEKAGQAGTAPSAEGLELAAFSPNGSVIVSAGGGGGVVIWDAQCDMQQQALDCREDGIKRCTWSPDATKVASGCENGTVVLWDALAGRELRRFKAHTEAVSGCEFSPDSALIATSSADGRLILWDVATGARNCACEGHKGPIARAEWSPDGSKLISAGADGKLGIWDAGTGSAIHMLKQHRGAVPCCSWCPAGKLITSCGWYDRSVMIWNAETGQVVHYLRGHTGAVTVCKWSPDGSMVVSGGARGEVIVWDARTGSKTAVLRGEHEAPEGCGFSPDGSMIFCYDSQKIHVWTADAAGQGLRRDGAARWEPLLQLQGHHGALSKCAWSPDSRFILSCGRDKRVVVWQVESGEAVYHLDGHQAAVGYANWSPDGTAVVSGDEESCLLLWGNLPRYSYMAAPGPSLFYFRIRLMHSTFERELASATATAHPSVLTACTTEGTTLLHLAAQYTDLELLVWMLGFAAEHRLTLGMSKDRSGSSPLDYAIQNQWWQGMSKIVGAIYAGIVRMSVELQNSLFTSAAFKILLRHFAGELEPLLKEGSACGVSRVANGFTVSDTSGILLKLGQEGISMVVAGSNHQLIPAVQMQSFWQRALLARAAQKRAAFGAQKVREQVDATAVVRLQRVGWAGCAAQAPNGILHSLLRSEVSAHVYGLPVVRAVIDLKWWSFARTYVMKELALYTLLLAMFTAYALALTETTSYGDDGSGGRPALQGADPGRRHACFADFFIPSMAISVLALVARFLTHELRQMQMYGRQHWASFWNWMNAVAFSLYVPVVLLHACGMRDAGAFKVLLATDAVLLWANLLHFAKAFRGTGALVQMVTMTVSDMRWFVLLLFVVMFGFGTSFLVLFSGGDRDRTPEFADVDNALLSMFLFMLGSFNMDAFDLAAVPSAAILLFVFYEVVVTVVLLNLLIAIMGESFSKVVENEEQQFLKGRAELIDEVEVAVLSRQAAAQNRAAWFPRYLHILRPGQQSVGEDVSEDPWTLALSKTERSMTALLEALQADIQKQLPAQVGAAVTAELNRFLEQPLAALGGDWDAGVPDGLPGSPRDGGKPAETIPARKGASRPKVLHLNA